MTTLANPAFASVMIFVLGCAEAQKEGPPAEPPIETSQLLELVAPGVISTDRNETFPAEDPVDGSLWFSIYDDSFGDQTIVVAVSDGHEWADPKVAPFSGEWGDRAPRFSLDGSKLYFTSNRPRPDDPSSSDQNIWMVRRTDAGWGEPEPVTEVNSAADDIHASVTNSAIWVASNREGGYGRSDVYRVSPDGSVNHLEGPINDENSQPDLLVAPDESWMILVITDHPSGRGGDDLYISRFDGESWSEPVNLGPEINSDKYEYGPTISVDGRYLYFTSHRNGSADVFRVLLSEVMGS